MNWLKKLILSLSATVLCARGYDNIEDVSAFFEEQPLCDPFLLADMDAACDTINFAIENGERICIYGDYDCDGITATALLYRYFECMGADVIYYIPERHGVTA